MTAKMVAVGYASKPADIGRAGRSSSSRRRCRSQAIATCWCACAGGAPSIRSTSRCACASRAPRPQPRHPRDRTRPASSRASGTDCRLFRPGDQVYYAGNINRPGTNAPFHLVDERIVGHAPKSLSFAEAAALPLTTLTAWELLFDRIGVQARRRADRRSLLIVGGAGGVGSIAIQLARKLTGLSVIATASRPQTQDLGAEPRRAPCHRPQQAVRPAAEGGGLCRRRHRLWRSTGHRTQRRADHGGRIASEAASALIEAMDSLKAFDTAQLWSKCVSIHPELMFTRSTLRHARHDRAASPARARRPTLVDRGVAAHDA